MTALQQRKPILCKYYMHGACNKGDDCPFTHSLTELPNLVCTHWLRGNCAYGDKCRYNHTRTDGAWVADKKDKHKSTSSHTVAYKPPPSVLKPKTDDLASQVPVSQLRFGGTGGSGGGSGSGGGGQKKDNGAPSNHHHVEKVATTAVSSPHHHLTPKTTTTSIPYTPAKIRNNGPDVDLPEELDLLSEALEKTQLQVDEHLLAQSDALHHHQQQEQLQQQLQEQQQHFEYIANASANARASMDMNEYHEYFTLGEIEGDGVGGGGGGGGGVGGGGDEYYYNEEGYYDENGLPLDDSDPATHYDPNDPSHAYWNGGTGTGTGSMLGKGTSSTRPGSSIYGSYGGHSSAGEYTPAAFAAGTSSTGTSPGMTNMMTAAGGGAGAGAGHVAWNVPSSSAATTGTVDITQQQQQYNHHHYQQQRYHQQQAAWSNGPDPSRLYTSPALKSLCWEYYNHGMCSAGETCLLAHGEWCETCGHYAVHPEDMAAREAHTKECKARHDRLEALRRSSHVECGICMERVTERSVPSDRRFGLLACDHPFCLSCIRSWRSQFATGADVDAALRTCPICRTPTHFITPSAIWPANAEEKERIVSGYTLKLAEIDCRHFNYGEGSCPFGSSCMYRHQYRDGRMEEAAPRRVAADEGEVRVVQPVRLSDFLVIQQGKVRGRRR